MLANAKTASTAEVTVAPMTRWERLKYTMVRPDEPDASSPADNRAVDEIQADIRRSSDKERAIGLVAAPVAAVVGLAISSASIGYAQSHHQSLKTYDELTYVLLGLSVLILVASLLRKRLFQGITLALFGVALFQLHYTYIGFAAPFVLAGAWYLIRTYRLQQELKVVDTSTGRPLQGARPRPSKRYTAPR